MPEMNKVLCNLPQNLSEPQKTQIRKNTGLVDSSSIAPIFDPERVETYPAKSLVMHDGVLYRFKVDHPTGAWTGDDVDPVELSALLGIQLTSWEDITSKLGSLVANSGRVVILYNRMLGMLDVSFWADFGTVSNQVRTLFSFNADIPVNGSGSSQQEPGNYAFGGDVLGRNVSENEPILASVRPYIAQASDQSNAITIRGGSSYRHVDSFWRIFMITASLKSAFEAYLDSQS